MNHENILSSLLYGDTDPCHKFKRFLLFDFRKNIVRKRQKRVLQQNKINRFFRCCVTANLVDDILLLWKNIIFSYRTLVVTFLKLNLATKFNRIKFIENVLSCTSGMGNSMLLEGQFLEFSNLTDQSGERKNKKGR